MLSFRDWAFALIIHCLLIPLLLSLSPRRELPEETPISRVEIVKRDDVPQRTDSATNLGNIPMDELTVEPLHQTTLPSPDIPQYDPIVEEYAQIESSWDTDWVDSIITDDFIMPSDPIIDDIPMDDLIPFHDSMVEDDSQDNTLQLSWDDGFDRTVLYFPPWEKYFNRELKNSLQEVTILFEINSEGYIIDVEVLEDLSFNQAWNDLVKNWMSQVVFVTGAEGRGTLTILFSSENL